MIEGDKPSEMLGFIPPQLATLKLKAQVGDKRILPKLYSMAAKVLNLAPLPEGSIPDRGRNLNGRLDF